MEELRARLVQRWSAAVAASPQVLRARDGLQLHRGKVRRLMEELATAEAWGKELQARCTRMEANLKPPILRFMEKVEVGELVEEHLLMEMGVGEWRVVIRVLEEMVARARGHMGRAELVRLVQTLLGVRRFLQGLGEGEQVEGAEGRVVELASKVLKHLGRGDLQWVGMEEWEAEVVRQVVGSVAGVPTFVARILGQTLGEVVGRVGREDKAVQAGGQEEG